MVVAHYACIALSYCYRIVLERKQKENLTYLIDRLIVNRCSSLTKEVNDDRRKCELLLT